MNNNEHTNHKDEKVLEKVVKGVIPLLISIALVVWLFQKVDLKDVKSVIANGIGWGYIVAMMVITILSHIIRGVRWGIQLRAAGIPRISAVAESVSIFGAYALNLVFPFLGEAWRCVYISHRENVKLSTVVGTDIGDRASDGIMILLIIILTTFVAHGAMDQFLDRYPVGEHLVSMAHSGELWLWIALILVTLVCLDYTFRHTATVKGIHASALRIWQGFAVLFHMKGTGMYLVYTIGIWTCYFLETYVCFFAYPFTRDLVFNSPYWYGIAPGLVVFVFGSCSMAVPSNGGLGPWNIAVMFALSLYGIGQTDAAAYALICWSFQTIVLIACGIFSAFYIMWSRKRGQVSAMK